MSKMSYRNKPYRDKRNLVLAESERLRQDIEELEDALILHSRFQSKDENSVRGMIRKEIGGSRWEHGGEGRLTTYRSERDLVEQTSRGLSGRPRSGQTGRKQQKITSRGDMGDSNRGVVSTGHRSRRGKSGAGTLREIMENKKQLEKQRKQMSSSSKKDDSVMEQPDLEVTCIKAEWGQVEREESPLRRSSPVEDTDSSKNRIKIPNASHNMDINDLKNKVLAKASSKVIDRKNFSAKSNLDSRNELQLSGRSHHDTKSREKPTASSHTITQRGDGDPSSGKYSNLGVLDTSSYALYKTTGAKSKQGSHLHKSNESLNSQIQKQNSDQDCGGRPDKDFIFRENKYDSHSKLKSQTPHNGDDFFYSDKWADSRETSLPLKEFDFQKSQRRNSYSSDTQKKITTSDSLEKPQRKSTSSTAVSLISQPLKASLTSNRSQQDHTATNSSKGFNQTSKSSNVSVSRDPVSVQSPTKVTDIFITNPTLPESIGTTGSTLPTSTHALAFSTRSLYNSTISSTLYNTDTLRSSSDLIPRHPNQQQLSTTDPKQSTTHVIQQSTSVCDIPTAQSSSNVDPVQLKSIKSKEDVEVEAWLHNLCLQSVDHYTKLFSDHQMDMASIKLLTANGLRDMGINALGPIMKIMKGVQILNRDEISPDRNTCRNSLERTGEQNDMVDSSAENDYIEKGMLDLIPQSGHERENEESKNREICNFTSKFGDAEKEYKTIGRNDQKKLSGAPGTKTQMSLSKLTGWKQTSEDADYANLKDRSPVSDVNVPENFVVKEKEMPKQKKKSGQPVKRSMSAKVRGKNAGPKVIGKPPAVSKNVEDGILTAAEKFSYKLQQQRLREEAEERSAARQKQMRDEMATKHIRRRSSSLDRNMQKSDTDRSHRSNLERLASFTTNNGAFEMSPRDSSRSAGVESVLSTRALPVKKKAKGGNRMSEKQQLDKASQNAINEMDEIINSLKNTSDSQNPEVRKSRSENQDLTLGAVRNMQKQLSHIEQQLIQGTSENQHSQQDLSQRDPSGSASNYSEEDSSPRHSARGRKSARERRRHRAAMGWGPDEEREGLALSASFTVPESNSEISMPAQQSLSASKSVNRQSSRSTELSVVNPSLPVASTVSDGSMQGSSRLTSGANVRSSIVGTEQKTKRSNELGKAAVTMTTTATTTVPHVNKPVEFDFSPLRDQNRKDEMQSLRQSIKPNKGNLGAIYHIENLKKVELDRCDISFSERDLLGDGAFSQVFKGTYQGSEVAVKRLKAPLQTIDKNYFIAEVSMLQELRHPHVVMLMGLCSSDNLPLMILEFLACGNLHTLLHDSDRSALESKDFCQIAHDVSAGMMYLHKHKPPVLHLDLKPRNVLIGHGMRAKVADFGFSKLKHEADMKVSRASKSRIVQGTPAWMAPELLAAGEITAKADVYSFGVVLWEMLTRQVPYEGCTVFQVLEMVRVNRRPSVPPDCPGSLSQLIQKCWDQNPAARPAFKEVIKSLELLLESTGWNIPGNTNLIHEDPVMSIDLSHQNAPLLNNTNITPRSVRRPERPQRSECVQLEIESFSSHGDGSEDESSGSSTDDNSEDSLSPKNSKQATPHITTGSSHDAKLNLRLNGKDIQDSGSPKTVEIHSGIASDRHTASPRQSISSLIKEGQDPAQELIAKYLPHTKSRNSVSKSHDAQPVLPAHGKLLPLRHSVDRPRAPVSLKNELDPFDQQTTEKNERQRDHVTNYTKDNHMSQMRLSNDKFRKSSKSQTEITNRKSSNNSLQLSMGMHNSHPDAQSYTPSFHSTRSEDLNLKESQTVSVDFPVHQKDRRDRPGFIPSSEGSEPTSSFMRSLNKAHSNSASGVGLRTQADRESKAHNIHNVSNTDKNNDMVRNVSKSPVAATKEELSQVLLKMDSQKSSMEDATTSKSTPKPLSEIKSNGMSVKNVENIENPSEWLMQENFSELQVLSQSVETPASSGDSQKICELPDNELLMPHQLKPNIVLKAEKATKSEEEFQINTSIYEMQNNSSLDQLSSKLDSQQSKNKPKNISEKPKYRTTTEAVTESSQQFSSVGVRKHEMSSTAASFSREANSNSDSESSTIPDDISEDSLSLGKDDDFTGIYAKESLSACAENDNMTKSKDWLVETSSFENKDSSLLTGKPDGESMNRNRESFFLFDSSDIEPDSLTQSTSVWNIENTTSLNQDRESSSSASHENQAPLQIVPNQKARKARRNTSGDEQSLKHDKKSAPSLGTQPVTTNKPAISLTEAMHKELLIKTRSAAENSESLMRKNLKSGMSHQENRVLKTGGQYKPSLSPNKPSHSIKTVPSSQATPPKEAKFLLTDSLLAKGRELLRPAQDSLPSQNIKPKSTGVVSFAVEASMLVERKGQLRSVTTREPPPIWKVAENAEEENLPSMASILKKAMTDRRFAMGDNHESADMTPEASWSIQEEEH